MTRNDGPGTDSDSSRDELADSPMPDAPEYTTTAVPGSSSSTEAVVGSRAKTMATHDGGEARSDKLQAPSRFPRRSRIAQLGEQQESRGWLRSGVSLFKSVVSPQREVPDSEDERDEVCLTQLESQIEDLKAKLELKAEQIVKHDKSYASERKRLDAKSAVEIQRLKDIHERVVREICAQGETELRRQKIGYEREAAVRQNKHEIKLNIVQQESNSKIDVANLRATEATKEVSKLQKTCRDFEEKIKAHETTIGRLQSARFKAVEASHWAPLEASAIEHQFASILLRVRKWSSEHALFIVDQVVDPEGFSNIIKALAERGCVVRPEKLHECLLTNKSMRKPGKASTVLLSAGVMHDIMQTIISDPYFAFLGKGHGNLLEDHHAGSLIALSQKIASYNKAGAEALRCQVLRLLDPPARDGCSVEVKALKDLTEKSRNHAVAKGTLAIMECFLGMLGPEDKEQAFNGLSAIIEDAAALSWSLWTRKAVVKVPSWTSMMEKEPNAVSYFAASEIFEPHMMHNMVLEDNPNALDGQDILLVCSPMVLMMGNADGEDYDKRKVLKKAIVWMG